MNTRDFKAKIGRIGVEEALEAFGTDGEVGLCSGEGVGEDFLGLAQKCKALFVSKGGGGGGLELYFKGFGVVS